jgi:hypothetical protein
MDINLIRKIINETFDNSSNHLKIGTIVAVQTGQGFNQATKMYVQTENGLARIDNYGLRRNLHDASGIDETDINPNGNRMLVENGISPGDKITSVIQLMALPAGSIVSWHPETFENQKIYTKLEDGKWHDDEGKLADSYHFDAMISSSSPPIWEQ